MTDTKFTPGPWATEGSKATWGLFDQAGRRIALIDKGGANAPENGRLIIAAPDMYEALDTLANNVEGLKIEEAAIRELIGNTNWECLFGRIEKARAALAKARGEA